MGRSKFVLRRAKKFYHRCVLSPLKSFVKKCFFAIIFIHKSCGKNLFIANLYTRGYQKVRALMLYLFNGIRYHSKHLSCVEPICV